MFKPFKALFLALPLALSCGSVMSQNGDAAKSLAAQFADPSRSALARLSALEKLRALDPALANKFEPTRLKLVPLAAKEAETLVREIDSIGSVMGIKVGMTASQVRNARNWGPPDRVNATTGPHGTSEQWVYRGGRYVYFRSGIVTSIQH